jgi:DNA-directed RNA polymerase subunit RPC12/RpoP
MNVIYPTKILLPGEIIPAGYGKLRCPRCHYWENEGIDYDPSMIYQMIERNKVNKKIELSYWVDCPTCHYEILLKRIT